MLGLGNRTLAPGSTTRTDLDQTTRRPARPVPHDGHGCVLPVRPLRSGLDDTIKPLEPKAPVATWRAVPPDIPRQMREEVVLRSLEAVVLGHLVEELRVLDLQIVDLLDVGHVKLVLDAG